MKDQKREPKRIIVAIISIVFIIYMWIEKDIVVICSSMPAEQALPLAVTTVAVSLFKVALMTVGILIIKWLAGKFKK